MQFKHLLTTILILISFPWLALLVTDSKILIAETKVEPGQEYVIEGYGNLGDSRQAKVPEYRVGDEVTYEGKRHRVTGITPEGNLELEEVREFFGHPTGIEPPRRVPLLVDSQQAKLVCKYFNGRKVVTRIFWYSPNNILGRDSCPFLLGRDE